MSEPVKTAEDLKEAYGYAVVARNGFVITLIQRVSAAEAELALAKEEIAALEAKCPAHEFCLDSDDAIRRRGVIAAEVSALREENARLKAPASGEEINAFTKVIAVPSWMRGAFIDCLNAMIRARDAARSKAPDGAQEAEGARDE